MSEQSVSALEAIRLLRNSIETRLWQNEDYRVLRVLDCALTELSQPKLPRVRQLQVPTTPQTSGGDSPLPDLSPKVAANPPAEADAPMFSASRSLRAVPSRIGRH
jgi:hypothetical protein